MVTNHLVAVEPPTLARLVQLLADLDAAGVQKLRAYHGQVQWGPREAVGPDLLERIRENKPALLAALEGRLVSRNGGDTSDKTECFVSPGNPCPVCGSLAKWWDVLGAEHCQQCRGDKLERGLALADRVTRLRGVRP